MINIFKKLMYFVRILCPIKDDYLSLHYMKWQLEQLLAG